ncbi:MAG: hypothetical protein ABIK09_14290 [Pseudomonadota bacterium]
MLRPAAVALAALCLLGCSAAPAAPEWYQTPPSCPHCYQGLGEGETYNAAKNRAKADLCDDLRVVVSSEMETTRAQTFRDSTSGGKAIDYDEVVRLVERSESNCVFEGMPLQEAPRPETVGDKIYVRLVLPFKTYASWLASRAVIIDVVATPPLPQSANATIGGALSGCVRDLGYLPHHGGKELPYRMEAGFSLAATDTGTGGLIVLRAHPVFKLVHVASGRIRWERDLGTLVARGFDRDKLVDDLAGMAAKKLEGACKPE